MAFIVKIEELNNAAQAYSDASKSYETHYTELVDAMNIAEGNWSDEAGNQWRDITSKANLELQKIKENLDANNALLAEVARAAAATQQKVTQGIEGIY